MAYCSNCGKRLQEGARFCLECGANVMSSDMEQQRVTHVRETHRCPNCGQALQSLMINCPACGTELRGKRSSSSIREFAQKLLQVGTESEKISVIRNFPIPNTKEDIFEFMILASSNFETESSREGNIQKEISQAWSAKIEQSYQKASLLFGNDEDFLKIQNVYDQIYEKINAQTQYAKKNFVVNLALRTIGLWGGLVIFIIAILVELLFHSNTSIYHLGGGIVMIIGAFAAGRKSKEWYDFGVGLASGFLVILIGTLFDKFFRGNASIMELAGIATIIITVIRLVKSSLSR